MVKTFYPHSTHSDSNLESSTFIIVGVTTELHSVVKKSSSCLNRGRLVRLFTNLQPTFFVLIINFQLMWIFLTIRTLYKIHHHRR